MAKLLWNASDPQRKTFQPAWPLTQRFRSQRFRIKVPHNTFPPPTQTSWLLPLPGPVSARSFDLSWRSRLEAWLLASGRAAGASLVGSVSREQPPHRSAGRAGTASPMSARRFGKGAGIRVFPRGARMASSPHNDLSEARADGGPGAGPRMPLAWKRGSSDSSPLRRPLRPARLRPEQTRLGDHCSGLGEATSAASGGHRPCSSATASTCKGRRGKLCRATGKGGDGWPASDGTFAREHPACTSPGGAQCRWPARWVATGQPWGGALWQQRSPREPAASGRPDASGAEICASAQAHAPRRLRRSRQLPGGACQTLRRCDPSTKPAATCLETTQVSGAPPPSLSRWASPIGPLRRYGDR